MAEDGAVTASPFFDEVIAGMRVQADGGNAEVGSRFASREMFEGSLTGRRMNVGDPPWRWIEIGELTAKPEDFGEDFVWCEISYVYPLDQPGARLA